jgi:hypothetical protein
MGSMFRDFDHRLGQVEHLPFLMPSRMRLAQSLPAADADRGEMLNHFVRSCHLPERRPLMPMLATGGPPRFLALISNAPWLLQAIACGGLPAIRTV